MAAQHVCAAHHSPPPPPPPPRWKHKPAARSPHRLSSGEQFSQQPALQQCSVQEPLDAMPTTDFLDTHTTFLPGLARTCVFKHPEVALTHLHSHSEPKQRVLLSLVPCPGPCQHRLPSPAHTTAIIFPTEVSCKKSLRFFLMQQPSGQTNFFLNTKGFHFTSYCLPPLNGYSWAGYLLSFA